MSIQVVRVGLVNLENDTTHGQTGSIYMIHRSRLRTTDQVSAWQAEWASRPTRRRPREDPREDFGV